MDIRGPSYPIILRDVTAVLDRRPLSDTMVFSFDQCVRHFNDKMVYQLLYCCYLFGLLVITHLSTQIS